MKLVAARFRSHDHLNRTGTTVLRRKSIGLNRGFLYRVRVRGQIENTGANITGHIYSIHDVHVPNAAASISASIHLRFGGVIIGSGTWAPSGRQPQPGYTWSHGAQREQVASLQG